jgi:hypothetical protein
MSTALFSKKKAQTPHEKALVDLNEFNTSFVSYMEENIKMIPDDNDLPLYLTMVNLALMARKTLVIKLFAKYVLPFKDNIEKRDEKYFLQDLKYDQVLAKRDEEEEKNMKTSDVLLKVLSFKKRWNTLNEEQKDYNFKMMKYLCYYAEKYDQEYRSLLG